MSFVQFFMMIAKIMPTDVSDDDYLFNEKKENLFHANFIFQVDQRDGSSPELVEGWEHE
jgi:hypothetical protein